MVLSHARTFAIKALSVPTGRGTNLLFAMELNYVAFAVAIHAKLHDIFEPSSRNLPRFVLIIPHWDGVASTSKPTAVID
jgi:hypothetical protein